MTAAAGVFKSEGLEATFDEGLHGRALDMYRGAGAAFLQLVLMD
jgi:hypothetical protein